MDVVDEYVNREYKVVYVFTATKYQTKDQSSTRNSSSNHSPDPIQHSIEISRILTLLPSHRPKIVKDVGQRSHHETQTSKQCQSPMNTKIRIHWD